MNTELYKIVYCSRNLVEGDAKHCDAEIAQILDTARRNNSSKGITGALLFNSGCFAQVLEGPRAAIETIFERIQCDPRHSDVAVLESGNTTERNFPEWAMAHVQPPSEERATGIAATLDQALLRPENSGHEVLALLRSLVVQDE